MCQVLPLPNIIYDDPCFKQPSIWFDDPSKYAQNDSFGLDDPVDEVLDRYLFPYNVDPCQNYKEYTDAVCASMQNYEEIETEKVLKNIIPEDRCAIIDWMLWVCMDFELVEESLFNAVRIFDIIISNSPVDIDEVQLIAAASLWISSKFAESRAPSVEDFVAACGGKYSADAILRREAQILVELGFKVSCPNALDFTDTFLSQVPVDPLFVDASRFYAYVALRSPQLAFARPSHIGLASIALAKLTLDTSMSLAVIPRSLPAVESKLLVEATKAIASAADDAISNEALSVRFGDFVALNAQPDLSKKLSTMDEESICELLDA